MDDDDPFVRHIESPFHRSNAPGEPAFMGTAHATNCGDMVCLELVIRADQTVEAWHSCAGCLVCRAGASLLCEYAEGRTLEYLKSMSREDQLALFGIELTPMRQACGLVGWRALQDALGSDPRMNAQ